LGASSYTFRDDHVHIVGTNEHDGASFLIGRLGLDCTPEAFLACRDDFLGPAFSLAPLLPGAAWLVEEAIAVAGTRCAIATSSSREYLHLKMATHAGDESLPAKAGADKAGMFEGFLFAKRDATPASSVVAEEDARIVCGDDCGPDGKTRLPSKPAPDIFLQAARRAGAADPAHCVVVEDSPAGVRSAVAAGMRVVYIQADAAVLNRDPEARDMAVCVAPCVADVDWTVFGLGKYPTALDCAKDSHDLDTAC
jgi:beta-phosphoglucomutase-like phosphatase (HAD superfamily)